MLVQIVTTIDEIVDNLIRFNNYSTSSIPYEREFFSERLRLGKNLVHGIVNGKHFFCPSRFVGYSSCTAARHIAFPYKNGSKTTPKINQILGMHSIDKAAEKSYRELCGQLNIEPSNKERSYWSVEVDQASLKDVLRSGNLGFPDETEEYVEGATKSVYINAHERNREARKACIEHYGVKCIVCDFDFEEKYGLIGKSFIHVHHLKPIAKQSGEHTVNPITDLRPVCPNCHAMLHLSDPPYTIEELVEIIGTKS